MSADRLREAARVLREAAEAATGDVPGVEVRLADWLDAAARDEDGGVLPNAGDRYPLAVADLILGGEGR